MPDWEFCLSQTLPIQYSQPFLVSLRCGLSMSTVPISFLPDKFCVNSLGSLKLVHARRPRIGHLAAGDTGWQFPALCLLDKGGVLVRFSLSSSQPVNDAGTRLQKQNNVILAVFGKVVSPGFMERPSLVPLCAYVSRF